MFKFFTPIATFFLMFSFDLVSKFFAKALCKYSGHISPFQNQPGGLRPMGAKAPFIAILSCSNCCGLHRGGAQGPTIRYKKQNHFVVSKFTGNSRSPCRRLIIVLRDQSAFLPQKSLAKEGPQPAPGS